MVLMTEADYLDLLTERELEVLKLHAVLTLNGVAERTGISVQTVKNHLNAAFAKLGVTGSGRGATDGMMPRERALLKLGWLQVPD